MRKVYPLKRVINFSGGKTSALMTILLKPTEKDIVLFTDTGREHEKTYKFIADFEKYEGIKVEKTGFAGGFSAYVKQEMFLPNRTARRCTEDLKIKEAKQYIRRNYGVTAFFNYIGFRADEAHRVKDYASRWSKVLPLFPLYELGITKAMVNKYWEKKHYTLEIPSILGNCNLCFLKGKNAIINILQLYPEMAKPWIQDEVLTGSSYFPDITYSELLAAASKIQTLPFSLVDIQPAYSCKCTT